MSHPAAFSDDVPFWNSVAAQNLGWRPTEFWQATPAELVAAIREPRTLGLAQGPGRELIDKMMEREKNERQF